MPKNDQIWPKIGVFGPFGPCRLLRCPVSGWVGGCGARAVSRKTPIYFMDIVVMFNLFTKFDDYHIDAVLVQTDEVSAF